MNDSGESLTRTEFQYDWDSIYPGFHPEEIGWGEPRPMADSPPNLRYPGYYSGPATTRLIAGAGPGEADMEDVAHAWGDQVPQQPPAPQQPTAPPPDNRTDQLIRQVTLLRDENLRLQNDVADLRQRANQRGRPRAPPY